MRKSIVKKGKVKNTFICLCMLFKEFHVRFGTESTWVRKNVLGSVPKALFDKSGRAGNVRKVHSLRAYTKSQ